MKTQLLQDLNESGSANARPPSPEAGKAASPATPAPAHARPPGPAVWHRPQRDQASEAVQPLDTTVPLPPPPSPLPPPRAPQRSPAWSPRPAEAELATVREARADAVRPATPANPHATVQPKGFAPQPLPFGAPLPAQGATGTGGDPDWLTERLARDTAVHDRSEWNGSWTRRLASWGAAGVLLALVAAGGFWLYEQSRVEGALVVVANTNPAPASAPRAVTPRALPALPSTPSTPSTPPATPIAASVDASEQPASATGAPAAGEKAAGETAANTTIESPDVAAVDISAPARSSRKTAQADRKERAEGHQDAVPPKHKRSSAHKQAKTMARATVRAEERSDERPDQRSYRQRYEETLMQCRAHGYDERQCLQRGCEMTRYGFACKG